MLCANTTHRDAKDNQNKRFSAENWGKLPSEEGGFIKRAQFSAVKTRQRHAAQLLHRANSDLQMA
jgi:hypothetical protein